MQLSMRLEKKYIFIRPYSKLPFFLRYITLNEWNRFYVEYKTIISRYNTLLQLLFKIEFCFERIQF